MHIIYIKKNNIRILTVMSIVYYSKIIFNLREICTCSSGRYQINLVTKLEKYMVINPLLFKYIL